MSPNETKVLAYLAGRYSEDFGFLPFDPIVRETRLDRRQVRLACRSLKRKGLAEFSIGLWTDDGTPAGAGYRATKDGLASLKQAEAA